jgi:RNA polymerase-binding transcription factor DksA
MSEEAGRRDDTEAARRRLLALRRETLARLAGLEGQVADVVEARRDANVDDEHDPEGSTLAFDRAQAAALARDAARGLVDVDAALARLDDGSYWTCARCGRPIGSDRLLARPTARLCVACQAVTERSGRS